MKSVANAVSDKVVLVGSSNWNLFDHSTGPERIQSLIAPNYVSRTQYLTLHMGSNDCQLAKIIMQQNVHIRVREKALKTTYNYCNCIG